MMARARLSQLMNLSTSNGHVIGRLFVNRSLGKAGAGRSSGFVGGNGMQKEWSMSDCLGGTTYKKNSNRLFPWICRGKSSDRSGRIASDDSKNSKDDIVESSDGNYFENDYPAEEDDEYQEENDAEIVTNGIDWAETALQAIQDILAEEDDLQLYSLKAIEDSMRLLVSLDKLSDKFGSPTLDEIGDFSLKLNTLLESKLGEEAAGMIEIEVSSPVCDENSMASSLKI